MSNNEDILQFGINLDGHDSECKREEKIIIFILFAIKSNILIFFQIEE